MKQNGSKMTKHLSLMLSLLLCSALLWTACSSDDDDNGDNGGGGSAAKLIPGVYEGEDGISYRLTSSGENDYVYDAQGNLTLISGGEDGNYEITTNPFTLYRSNKYGSISISKCSFNAQGYLTKFTLNEIYDYSGEYQDATSVYSISYNGNGQISKISTSETEVEKWEGETYKGSGSEELTFTYENGNLINVKEVVKGSIAGYSFKGNGLTAFTYGSIANAAQQYTLGVGHYISIDDQVAALAMIGYLGKASKYLPTQIRYTYTYSGDEQEEEDETATYSYKLGTNNSLVITEKENNSTYTYKYASDTKAIDNTQPSTVSLENNTPARRRHGILKHWNRK
jgi:hypothetical protein